MTHVSVPIDSARLFNLDWFAFLLFSSQVFHLFAMYEKAGPQNKVSVRSAFLFRL